MRTIISHIYTAVLLCGVMAVLGCFENNNNEEKEGEEIPVSIYNDPIDLRVLSATSADGTSIVYLGEKEDDGTVTAINSLEITTSTGEESTITFKDGKPSVFYLSNGVVAEFVWESETTASFSMMDKTGEYSFHTFLDLSIDSPIAPSSTRGAESVSIRRDKKVSLSMKETSNNYSPDNEDIATRAKPGDEKCLMYVKRCDVPYDPNVWVVMTNLITGSKTPLSPKRIGNGVYEVIVKGADVPQISFNPRVLVDIINKSIGGVCDVYDNITAGTAAPGMISGTALCTTISSGLMMTPAIAVVPEFFVACESIVAVTELSCTMHSLVVEKLLDGLADLIDRDFDFDFDYSLQPIAAGMPYNTFGPLITVEPGTLSSKTINFDMGGRAFINNFILSPSNPGQGQSYVATAKLTCIRAGSTVAMSISGTDGYQDSTSAFIENGMLSGEFSLHVPGAESGVRDVCRIQITDPNGVVSQKSASLVFGN